MTRKKFTPFFLLFFFALFLNSRIKQNYLLPHCLQILFPVHTSEHRDSEKLAHAYSKEYFKEGINISNIINPEDLNDEKLKAYD